MKKATGIISAVAGIIILALFLGQEYISYADLSLENPAWNGLSSLPSTALQPLYALSGLSGAGDHDTLLISGPDRNFTADESGMVAAFLDRGGKVVVMDDYGTANSLLGALGSPILVNRIPLCDNDNYYINRSFPVISNISQFPETANVNRLISNHPVSLDISGDAVPLAFTSKSGWLDANSNTMIDGYEHMGTYCIAAKASYGKGELLVIGDPDLFINGMISMGDNRVFASDILAGKVWLDVSHGNSITPMGAAYYALKYDPTLQAAVVLFALAGCLAYVKRDGLLGWIRALIR